MSNSAKKEYLTEIRKRYFLSTKAEKSLILDELCTVCKFNRKYAIRVLAKKQTGHNKRKGRPPVYHHQAIIEFLKDLWVVTNLACAERIKAAIPLWLPYYQFHKNNSLNENEQKLLLEISPSTIKRLLRKLKSKHRKFGLSTTKPGSLIKKQVPIKLNQWDESVPGFIEADTVAHCGSSVSGQFTYTLNIVDIATGWTEQRAVWGKGKAGVFDAIKNIRKALVESCSTICCWNILQIKKIRFNIHVQESTRKMTMLILKRKTGLMSDNSLVIRDLIILKP